MSTVYVRLIIPDYMRQVILQGWRSARRFKGLRKEFRRYMAGKRGPLVACVPSSDGLQVILKFSPRFAAFLLSLLYGGHA